MYKYTVRSDIVRYLLKIRRSPKIDQEFHYVKSLVGADYMLNWVFRRQFIEFQFFSTERLQAVPMGGYLFPISLFDEEIV